MNIGRRHARCRLRNGPGGLALIFNFASYTRLFLDQFVDNPSRGYAILSQIVYL